MRKNAMDKKQKARLEAAGWRIDGSLEELLGLTPEEMALIELKVTLAMAVRERRISAGLTQAQLAKMIGTKQPRINKLETPGSDVSIDAGIKALVALGMTRKALGQLMGGSGSQKKAPRKPARRRATKRTKRGSKRGATKQAA